MLMASSCRLRSRMSARLGTDFDDVLLLPLGAGQVIAIAEQLQIGQAAQRPRASTGASAAATISKRF